MSVELKEVTPLTFPYRASQLHDIVNTGKLRTVNPSTIERYRTWPNAIRNARSLATREGIHAYVVLGYENLSPIGIATVIRKQRLKLEDSDYPVLVHDLDYNLLADASDKDHRDTAIKLISRSRSLAWRYDRASVALGPDRWSLTEEDASHNAVATIDPKNPDINRGFTNTEFLEPVTAQFVELGKDGDYIAKDGIELNYYFGHEILTSKP